MLTFKQFIVEDEFEIDNLAKIVARDCKPYLTEIKNEIQTHRLLRGFDFAKGDHFVGRVRTDRKPRDTDPTIHKLFDEALEEKFGIKFRSNSVFCTSSLRQAKFYGDPYLIYPIGEIKYVWSPRVNDFSFDYKNLLAQWDREHGTEFSSAVNLYNGKYPYKDSQLNELKEFFRYYIVEQKYTDKDIELPTRVDKPLAPEIMISCENYYAIGFEWISDNNLPWTKTLQKYL